MTPEILLLLFIVAVMIVLFIGNFLPVDLTAVSGLCVLIVLGYISPERAFNGFSSPAVVTMLCMFFLGAALRSTGVAEVTAPKARGLVGDTEFWNLIAVMLMAATLSAFMNNIAATAVLLPAVVSIGHQAHLLQSGQLARSCL